MDPELKALLTALAEGQIKLAEGQVALAKGQAALTEGQAAFARDTKAAIGELAGHVSELADHVVRLDEKTEAMAEALTDLGRRMDGYAQAVVKGFTAGAGRDGKLERRMEAAEARLARLEKRRPPPPRRKRG